MISFTLLTLDSRGKIPQYQLDKRLDVPQFRSGSYGEEKNLTTAENRIQVIQPVARRPSLSPASCILGINEI
jgi:hypothetical protein